MIIIEPGNEWDICSAVTKKMRSGMSKGKSEREGYAARREELPSDAELLDELRILVVIFSFEVAKKSLSLSYQFQKPKTR